MSYLIGKEARLLLSRLSIGSSPSFGMSPDRDLLFLIGTAEGDSTRTAKAQYILIPSSRVIIARQGNLPSSPSARFLLCVIWGKTVTTAEEADCCRCWRPCGSMGGNCCGGGADHLSGSPPADRDLETSGLMASTGSNDVNVVPSWD